METAPAKIHFSQQKWFLRIQKQSKIRLSPGMAERLGIQTLLVNDSSNVKDFPISYMTTPQSLDKSLYFIGCEQGERNFIDYKGVQRNVIDFFYATNDSLITVMPKMSSVPLEATLHNRLSFTVFNSVGERVNYNDFHLIVVFQLRKYD
jgi:hypothetical protein